MNSIETEEVKILTLWLDFYKKKVLQINKSFLISDLNRIHKKKKNMKEEPQEKFNKS